MPVYMCEHDHQHEDYDAAITCNGTIEPYDLPNAIDFLLTRTAPDSGARQVLAEAYGILTRDNDGTEADYLRNVKVAREHVARYADIRGASRLVVAANKILDSAPRPEPLMWRHRAHESF